ncbi:MAG: hypothetical protein NTW10_04095 [Bacteroidetes bacterium]|nr:hypothetical protein [Bacteroidota bacterium]
MKIAVLNLFIFLLFILVWLPGYAEIVKPAADRDEIFPDTVSHEHAPSPTPLIGTFNSLGSGTFIFAGTTPQSVTGPNGFANVTINNANGLAVNSETRIDGILTLTTGLVTLGANNLVLGSTATVAGTPSASSMIVPTGTGQLMKIFSSTGSFTYPVGDNTGAAEYTPVTLAITAGSFGTNANVGVNLANLKYPYDSVAGSYLNRYWTLTQQNITGFACNLTFQYKPADVVGTEAQLYCEKVNPLPIVEYNATNPVTHQLTATGVNTLGTFTGNRAQYKYVNLKLFLEEMYIGAGTMRAAWDISGPKWGASIADHLTVELHDPVTYSLIRYTANDVVLSTTGNATVTIPRAFSGNYYVTIKHRSSLETVTALPVLITTPSLSYDYSTTISKAYGNNLKSLGGGVYGLYSGDLSSASTPYPAAPVKDGVIDLLDNYYIYSSFLNGDYGYKVADLNGDGVVDLMDAYLAYTNFLLGIYAITP